MAQLNIHPKYRFDRYIFYRAKCLTCYAEHTAQDTTYSGDIIGKDTKKGDTRELRCHNCAEVQPHEVLFIANQDEVAQRIKKKETL